jgi:hypothetical protein
MDDENEGVVCGDLDLGNVVPGGIVPHAFEYFEEDDSCHLSMQALREACSHDDDHYRRCLEAIKEKALEEPSDARAPGDLPDEFGDEGTGGDGQHCSMFHHQCPSVTKIQETSVPGYTTYRLEVTLKPSAKNVYAIFGHRDSPLHVPAAWHDEAPWGTRWGPPKDALLDLAEEHGHPYARFDSWLSLGLEPCSGEGHLAERGLFNGNDGQSWTEKDSLDADNGALFCLSPQSGPADRTPIVVGQLTVPTGAGFEASFGMQGKSNGTCGCAHYVAGSGPDSGPGESLCLGPVYTRHGRFCEAMETEEDCQRNQGSGGCAHCQPDLCKWTESTGSDDWQDENVLFVVPPDDSPSGQNEPGQDERCESVFLGPDLGFLHVFRWSREGGSDGKGGCELDVERFELACEDFYEECMAFLNIGSADGDAAFDEDDVNGEEQPHEGRSGCPEVYLGPDVGWRDVMRRPSGAAATDDCVIDMLQLESICTDFYEECLLFLEAAEEGNEREEEGDPRPDRETGEGEGGTDPTESSETEQQARCAKIDLGPTIGKRAVFTWFPEDEMCHLDVEELLSLCRGLMKECIEAVAAVGGEWEGTGGVDEAKAALDRAHEDTEDEKADSAVRAEHAGSARANSAVIDADDDASGGVGFFGVFAILGLILAVAFFVQNARRGRSAEEGLRALYSRVDEAVGDGWMRSGGGDAMAIGRPEQGDSGVGGGETRYEALGVGVAEAQSSVAV